MVECSGRGWSQQKRKMLAVKEFHFHAVIRNLGFILQAMGSSWNILNRIVT